MRRTSGQSVITSTWPVKPLPPCTCIATSTASIAASAAAYLAMLAYTPASPPESKMAAAEEGPLPAADGDGGELCARRSALVHVTGCGEGIEGGNEGAI